MLDSWISLQESLEMYMLYKHQRYVDAYASLLKLLQNT